MAIQYEGNLKIANEKNKDPKKRRDKQAFISVFFFESFTTLLKALHSVMYLTLKSDQ
jgi:hypothetical protein